MERIWGFFRQIGDCSFINFGLPFTIIITNLTSLGEILEQILSSTYRIDSETQFWLQWKSLPYEDLTEKLEVDSN